LPSMVMIISSIRALKLLTQFTIKKRLFTSFSIEKHIVLPIYPHYLVVFLDRIFHLNSTIFSR
jgi:hypothetical protein